MRRWVPHLLTGLTVLLLALWLASGRWEVGWTFKNGRKGITPGVDQGGFFLDRWTAFGPREGPWISDTPYRLRWLPASEIQRWPSLAVSRHSVSVPLYIPAALTGSLACLAWRRRRRRDLDGTCTKCGYDLRGLPAESEAGMPVCPECGT